MGFFNREDKNPPEALIADVASRLYAGRLLSTTQASEAYLNKIVGKNIAAIRGYLLAGETIRMITFGRFYVGAEDVGVLTNLGCFAARKGRVDLKRLLWADIESITSGTGNDRRYVCVQTESYRLDFAANDYQRLDQQMSFDCGVERDVEAIVSMIRTLKNLG